MSFISKVLHGVNIENFLHLIENDDLQEIIQWNNCTSYSYRQREITLSRFYLELTIKNLLIPSNFYDEDLIYLERLEIKKLSSNIKKHLLKKYNVSEE